MTAKIKKKINITAQAMKEIRKQFAQEVGAEIGPQITALIEKGISPVAGQGRFQKYSDTYRRAIRSGAYGNKSPSKVNLKVTGDLHASQKVKISETKVSILYSDKKAAYHNEGGPNLPRRAMIPTEQGEKFHSPIQRALMKKLREIIDKYFR